MIEDFRMTIKFHEFNFFYYIKTFSPALNNKALNKGVQSDT